MSTETPFLVAGGQVDLVDFGVVAEGTANQWNLSFEEVVLDEAFVEFAKDIVTALVVLQCSLYQFLRDTTLAFYCHWRNAA